MVVILYVFVIINSSHQQVFAPSVHMCKDKVSKCQEVYENRCIIKWWFNVILKLRVIGNK